MTGYMTQYRKSESKGESAYLIKFAHAFTRTRARVRIKKTKFGEYPKERRKNNKNCCRTGERVAKFSVRQNSRFAFLGKFSRLSSEFLSPRVLRPQF